MKMKNFKTSLVGLFLAVLTVMQPFAENGDFNLKRDAYKFTIAVALAVFGFLAKDFDKTGV